MLEKNKENVFLFWHGRWRRRRRRRRRSGRRADDQLELRQRKRNVLDRADKGRAAVWAGGGGLGRGVRGLSSVPPRADAEFDFLAEGQQLWSSNKIISWEVSALRREWVSHVED